MSEERGTEGLLSFRTQVLYVIDKHGIFSQEGEKGSVKKMEQGIVNAYANVNAWFDEDIGEIIIVIETECGGYYERTISAEEIMNGYEFSFVPEGA